MIRVLIAVILCHFIAYGMYSSQLPVYLGETFVWNGHAVGVREFSYLVMADGAINILARFFLPGWLGRLMTGRGLMLMIFALICTGFTTAGLATTIPALAVLCVCTADTLAEPTYLAALSRHVPPKRQGVALGAAQSLIAGADVSRPCWQGLSSVRRCTGCGLARPSPLAGPPLPQPTSPHLAGGSGRGRVRIARPQLQHCPSIQRREVGGAFFLHRLQPQLGRWLRLTTRGSDELASALCSARRNPLERVLICGSAGSTPAGAPQQGQAAPARLAS